MGSMNSTTKLLSRFDKGPLHTGPIRQYIRVGKDRVVYFKTLDRLQFTGTEPLPACTPNKVPRFPAPEA